MELYLGGGSGRAVDGGVALLTLVLVSCDGRILGLPCWGDDDVLSEIPLHRKGAPPLARF